MTEKHIGNFLLGIIVMAIAIPALYAVGYLIVTAWIEMINNIHCLFNS